VWFLSASDLKKSTLFLLNASVIFTPSSLKANSAIEGKKSGITLTSPRGSFVYFIFEFIYCLSFAPVTRADNSNNRSAISKSYRQNATFNYAKTIKARFGLAMTFILCDDPQRVGKRILGKLK